MSWRRWGVALLIALTAVGGCIRFRMGNEQPSREERRRRSLIKAGFNEGCPSADWCRQFVNAARQELLACQEKGDECEEQSEQLERAQAIAQPVIDRDKEREQQRHKRVQTELRARTRDDLRRRAAAARATAERKQEALQAEERQKKYREKREEERKRREDARLKPFRDLGPDGRAKAVADECAEPPVGEKGTLLKAAFSSNFGTSVVIVAEGYRPASPSDLKATISVELAMAGRKAS